MSRRSFCRAAGVFAALLWTRPTSLLGEFHSLALADGTEQPETSTDWATDFKAASADVYAAFVDQLDITTHTVEYLYAACAYDSSGGFEWVVSDELADDTAVGYCIRDFDGNGYDELLVVRWRYDRIDLDLYQCSPLTGFQLLARLSDTNFKALPIWGNGVLEVLCDAEGTIYVQSWSDSSPIDNWGPRWNISKYKYEYNQIFPKGGCSFGAQENITVEGISESLASVGLDSLRNLDPNTSLNHARLSELDPTLTLITVVKTQVDPDAAATALEAWQNVWGFQKETGHLGTFEIGPNTGMS